MNFFKGIYYLFFIAVSLVVLGLVASVFPLSGGYKILVVQSGSMQPQIKTGSLVVLRPAEDYAVGEIVTFKYGETLITHRIFEKKVSGAKTVYVTKGDANKSSDKNEITEKEILGKVFINLPYAGYAVETAKKPAGFILIVAIPAMIIIFDEIKKIFQAIREIRAKRRSQAAKNKSYENEEKEI